MTFGPEPPDATPLSDEDVAGLIPSWVATRAELNEVEQANIEEAVAWYFLGRRRFTGVDALLSIAACDELHRRMFDDVCRWAGRHRRRGTNIGVAWEQITVKMHDVFADAAVWHHERTFDVVEIAVRLHHRLVSVHPYPNGNGRHSRMFADVYLHTVGAPRLCWGGVTLTDEGVARRTYIDALRAADHADMGPLIAFATAAPPPRSHVEGPMPDQVR